MDQCILCQALRLKVDPAKYNEVFAFPIKSATSKRWAAHLNEAGVTLNPDNFETFTLCEMHFEPNSIVRTKGSEVLRRARLEEDALPMYVETDKIYFYDAIPKKTSVKTDFRQYVNLFHWMWDLKGKTLTLTTKCKRGSVVVADSVATAIVNQEPFDVSRFTKEPGKLEQWSKFRGLLQAIENELELEPQPLEVMEMWKDVEDKSALQLQILCQETVDNLGWKVIQTGENALLYKIRFDSVPQISASIELSKSLNVTAFLNGKPYLEPSTSSIDSIKRLFGDLERLTNSEVPEEDLSTESVKNFVNLKGHLCRICLFWSQDVSKFVKMTREYFDLIEESGSQFSRSICHKCHWTLESFKQLKQQAISSQDLFHQVEHSMNVPLESDDFIFKDEDLETLIKEDDSDDEDFTPHFEAVESDEPPEKPAPEKREKKPKHQKGRKKSRGVRAMRSCDLCGFVCSYKDDLSNHMRSNHVTPTIECCGKLWNPKRYQAHQRTVHVKGQRCDLCGKSFGYSNSLRLHLKKTHGRKGEFVCDQCGKDFSLNSYLLKHLVSAHGQSTAAFLVCDMCGSKYLTPSALSMHKKSAHKTGQQPQKLGPGGVVIPGIFTPLELPKEATARKVRAFKCEICPLSYDTEAHLKRHMTRVHDSDARKFECAVCPKDFCTNYELNIHMRTIHIKEERKPCPICGKVYSSKTVMRKHLVWNHTDSHYRCTCGKKVKQCNTLRMHLKAKHNVTPTTEIVLSMKVKDDVGIAEKYKIFKDLYKE